MTIHIFNPEHEHALAANLTNFTPPHAARQLRSDLAFFPALWAADGDAVIVEDISSAESAYRKLKLQHRAAVRFVTVSDVPRLVLSSGDITVRPWGWDATICAALRRAGIPEKALPSVEMLAELRALSNRSLAVDLLKQLTSISGTTGQSLVCNSVEEVMQQLAEWKSVVVKAPWSCSGRGIRYLTPENATENVIQWMRNILRQQHSLIVERKCQRVADFAVEYYANADGTVEQSGLSLFSTVNGAYTGNLLDTEEHKREELGKYIPLSLLDTVTAQASQYLADRIKGMYTGPFGIDMMIVAGDGADAAHPFLLNPCIEINMRRTMGHAALALSDGGQRGIMNIAYENKQYKVKLTNDIL